MTPSFIEKNNEVFKLHATDLLMQKKAYDETQVSEIYYQVVNMPLLLN